MARANERSGFFGLTVSRPIAMGVLFVTLVLLGVIAYGRIPLQFLPGGLSGTRFTIFVPNPGANAQENVDKVARVLEEQFRTLAGIDEITSSSSNDQVRFRVKFNGEAETELAKAELRDRIERARPDLPETVEQVWIWASDDGDLPIMWFAAVSDERSADAAVLVDKYVQKGLEAVDGVSRVSIFGLLDDSIRIFLDEDKVAAARLDLTGLVRGLASDNFTQPLGEVSEGGKEFLLRSDMRFKTLDDIREYPVREGLRIKDIATVERVNSVRDQITRIDGGYAYYGMVQKEGNANVVEVGRALEAKMAAIQSDPRVAGKVSTTVFFNQADFIESSIERLEDTAIQGGGLAILVLFMFLRRARMTLCVALCIPVSALLAVAFEAARGGSFNVLTMTGLTLGIGMLVDNAVVVIESIARQRDLGRSQRDAAVLGARDVGLAVALATMTSVVVFLPLIFMGEQQISIMLQAMGVPLCASLVFSLLIALVFIPTASARTLGDRPAWALRAGGAVAALVALPTRALAFTIGAARWTWYRTLHALHLVERGVLRVAASPLRWPLAAGTAYLAYLRFGGASGAVEAGRRLAAVEAPRQTSGVLLGAAVPALLAAAILLLFLLLAPRLRRSGQRPPARPASFVPEGSSMVAWAQAVNRTLLTWTLGHRWQASLLSLAAVASIMVPWGNTTITSFGEDEDTSRLSFWVDLEDNFTLSEASEEIGRYERFVEDYKEEFGFRNVIARFDPGGGEVEMRWPERIAPKQLEVYRARIRRELPREAGHQVYFRDKAEVSDSSKQFVRFEIRGPDPDRLRELSAEAIAILDRVPGLEDVSVTTEDAPDQLLLDVDGDTAYSYGVSSQAALQNVSWALRGAQLPRYQEEDREVPMFIEYDDTVSAGLDTLRDLSIWGEQGEVALATFADVRFQPAPSRINRKNGQISEAVVARLADPARQSELVRAGYAALEGLDLPRGYELGRDSSVVVQGLQEMRDLQNAMLLSVVLVFLLMGILFESLLLPLSVLTTIPFAVLGAFWTLYASGTPMDSVGWIGIIILVGVVVNNGIVLIDKIHRLRVDDGLDREVAVVEGAAARVRPILMTALTTVVGLLPMALGEAPTQGIDYRALATCVAGGLAICTFFTLWVVPLAYTVIDDLSLTLGWLGRRSFAAGRGRRGGEPPRPALASPRRD